MWKVTGVLSDRERAWGDQRKPVYGPMPKKVWIDCGERHRVTSKPTNGLKSAETPIEYNERRAAQYCQWLAQRDGVALPANPVACALTDFATVDGKRERRVRAVAFYERASDYSTRRGDFLAEIAIPNWDWVPADPVHEIIDDDLPLAA